MKHQRRKGLGNRGIALAQTGIVLIALVSLVAVGVDVGRIALTATEVQTLADLSATAGAKEMLDPKLDGTARAGADEMIELNAVDNQTAVPDMVTIETGSYDFDNQTFTDGGNPVNAVRATGQATVNTILAGMFGSSSETVTKNATAALSGIGGGQADLPIAVGDCNFPDPDCMEQSCLPGDVVLTPDQDDTGGWTSFFLHNASAEAMRSFFPEACGGQAEGELSPPLHVGDQIEVNNGQASNLLNLLADCLANGVDEFFVPVIECNQTVNQQVEVVGFARIQITEVDANGQDQHITLGAIFDAGQAGPPGGGNFGTPIVALVK